jgi:hypothetical protein
LVGSYWVALLGYTSPQTYQEAQKQIVQIHHIFAVSTLLHVTAITVYRVVIAVLYNYHQHQQIPGQYFETIRHHSNAISTSSSSVVFQDAFWAAQIRY